MYVVSAGYVNAMHTFTILCLCYLQVKEEPIDGGQDVCWNGFVSNCL